MSDHRIRVLEKQQRRGLTPEARRAAGEELDALRAARRRQARSR